MTLRATRDPTFHPDAYTSPAPDHVSAGTRPAGTPRLTRLVSGVQLLSTLLAVPLGLASGYSIYRANFAPETNCQNLRAGIIAMLDKNVDAATRHMLVRRDVETFERSCGAFDPDAKAAFKRLLASDRTPTTVVRHAEAKPKNVESKNVESKNVEPKIVETKPKEAEAKSVRKVESHPPVAKQAATNADAPRNATVRAEAAPESDTAWVSAVREALVKHEAEPKAQVVTTAAPPAPLTPLPIDTAAPVMAPKLPDAQVIAGPPAQPATAQPPAADHPVPPAPVGALSETPPAPRSGMSEMIAGIPLLGPVVDAVRGR